MLRHSSRTLRRSGRKLLNAFLSYTHLRSRKVVEEAIRHQYRSSLRREVNPSELTSSIDMIYEEGLGLRRVLKGIARSPEAKVGLSYQDWVRAFDTIGEKDRSQIRSHTATLQYRPLISIVMPVYNTPENFLRAAITSVCNQLYDNWELCITDDASTVPWVPRMLEEMAALDQRIKWRRHDVNGNISRASNTALALAEGEFVALLDHDDVLPEQALYEIAVELNRHRDADIIYSDEDRLDEVGARIAPNFKPDWNPELFLGCNLISHLGVYRRSLLVDIGGFREGFEGSQDYDLAMRAINASRPEKIRHIPAILYHWRKGSTDSSFSQEQPQKCADAARRAKADYLAARNERGEVVENPLAPNFDRVRRQIPSPPPLVTLIVPTFNRHDLLGPCIEGLLDRTDYPAIEIIIIDHASDEPETVALLARLRLEARVRIMPYTGQFNYSDMNNKAVQQAQGEIIGFINNDIDVIEPGWLTEMVSLAIQPVNGAIGAKLIYRNDCVQHAGIVLGMRGIAGHAFRNCGRDSLGYAARLALTANVSAVTGACLVVRKSVFQEVGGFNTRDLRVAFNDVDLCLKIAATGYRNVWTPFALLYHYELASRGFDTDEASRQRAEREASYMRLAWPDLLGEDPTYNPNLSIDDEAFRLALPPRRTKPWRVPILASLLSTPGANSRGPIGDEPAHPSGPGSMSETPGKTAQRVIRVGFAGTFDVENYGDLLFPALAQAALGARDPRIEVVPISPNGKSGDSWPYAVQPAERLPELIPELDAMMIGGGQIVRFDKSYPVSVPPKSAIPICYWLMPAAMAAMAGKPVVWNGVGVWTDSPMAPWYSDLFRYSLMASRSIGVRDEASLAYLERMAPEAEITLVPDTAFSLSKIWPLAAESNDFAAWRASLGLHGPYAIVQANAAMKPHRAAIDAALKAKGGLAAVLLPICWCHGDRTQSFPQLDAPTFASEAWLPARLISEIIGRSSLVITSSFHASITGLVYGVPVIRVPASPIPTDRKFEMLRGYDGIVEVSDNAAAMTRLLNRNHGVEHAVVETIARVEQHWDGVAAMISKTLPPQQAPGMITMLQTVWNECVELDPQTRRTSAGLAM